MSQSNRESYINRLAFVGNLPPDATAEEMKELCSQVGEAVMFRIVYDRETGKPKGYGFCEYRDPKLVDAAVDLLHNFEVKGQQLYVRRADQEKQSMQQNNNLSNNNSVKKKKKKLNSSKKKSVDEITRVVSQFSMNEKREILSQMKLLIEQNENGAKKILLDNPQLAQALLLIQMEFNLVKSQDISALITHVSNNDNNTTNNNNNNDIVMQNTANPNVTNLNIQQKNVLSKVLSMTPQQIAKLPEKFQKQIRSVQSKLAKNKS